MEMAPGNRIMVVDDQPANLKLMEDMLRQQGYHVRSFPRGRLALAAAAQQPPDLVLLDINMPEMDGFEVCRRFKEDPQLATVPVIFLSALTETEDKVRALKGGAADYITKPFQFEEVQARVRLQLELLRARRAEQELLERTLKGAVKTLVELVQASGPALSVRSEGLRNLVGHMTVRLRLDSVWEYEPSAMLALIGCITLPTDVFERGYASEPLPPEEDRMFRDHAEIGARLLGNIPRLENVAEIIRHQLRPAEVNGATPVVQRGTRMLGIALKVDACLMRGLSLKAALAEVVAKCATNDLELVRSLDSFVPRLQSFETQKLRISDLQVAMTVGEDVFTQDGTFMILQKGTDLNFTLIERLRNFAKTRGIRQPITVRVARLDASTR